MSKFLTMEDVKDIKNPITRTLLEIDDIIRDSAFNDNCYCDIDIHNEYILCDIIESLENRGFSVDIDKTYVYSPYPVITVSW